MELPKDYVIEDYRIVRTLGTGGAGVAYEAIQQRLDRRVCLKVIRSKRANDPRVIGLFRTEAQALAKLAHPGIVTIFDFGFHEDNPYIVMELVDGEPLDQWVNNRPTDFAFAFQTLRAVGSALAYVHGNGIVHRDIKPSNILVNSSGHSKLADFGLAKIVENDLGVVDTGGIGTPVFVAPEVMQGRRYDHRADIYSMGIVAFFLLTGQLPGQGDQASQLNPEIPTEVDAILSKALASRPADRYEMVKTFINDLLNAFHDGDPLESPIPRMSSSPIAPTKPVGEGTAAAEDSPPAGRQLVPIHDFETLLPGDVGLQTPLPMADSERPKVLSEREHPQASTVTVETTQPKEVTGVAGIAPYPAYPPRKRPLLLIPAVTGAAILLVVAGWALGHFAGKLTVGGQPVGENASPSRALDRPSEDVANALPEVVPTPAPPQTPQATPPATPSAIPPATPQVTASATPPPPPATAVALPASNLFPTTPWIFDRKLDLPARPYSFLAVSRAGLWACTFNTTSKSQSTTDVYLVNLESFREQMIVSLPSAPQRGIGGIAVSDAKRAIFVTQDSGEVEGSGVFRFGFEGTPDLSFGTSGRVTLPQRPLGCALAGDRLFVLVAWGYVVELDPESGATLRTEALSSGMILRDIAISGTRLGAYGNGTFLEYDLEKSNVLHESSVLESATARSTEGIGVNPTNGEFIVRPPGMNDFLSLSGNQKLVSTTQGSPVSSHVVDVAVSVDGATLYASDLLGKGIMQFRRQSSGAIAPQTNVAPAASEGQSASGWVEYTDALWETQIQRGAPFIAIFHHDDSADSERFLSGVLTAPELKDHLGRLPRLSHKVGSSPDSKILPQTLFGKAPELLIMGNAGLPIARFGRQSSPQEIAATLNVLEIK